MNRAAIITALMTFAGTMTSHSVQADSGKQKGMTPPGLEKHHFMSPGQTKKWKKGAFVPADMAIIPCAEWDSLHLAPPPRGAFYGYVDQDLLLIA
ncbi:MAG: hypothetical protein ACK56I_04380, partial [bacterium]